MEAGMCSCDYDGCECDLVKIERRKARKAHRCVECGEPIEPGTYYEHARCLCEGEWSSDATCIPCSRIRKNFCAPIGALRDELIFALGFDYVTGEEVPDFNSPMVLPRSLSSVLMSTGKEP